MRFIQLLFLFIYLHSEPTDFSILFSHKNTALIEHNKNRDSNISNHY
jgi:hypothetical protein